MSSPHVIRCDGQIKYHCRNATLSNLDEISLKINPIRGFREEVVISKTNWITDNKEIIFTKKFEGDNDEVNLKFEEIIQQETGLEFDMKASEFKKKTKQLKHLINNDINEFPIIFTDGFELWVNPNYEFSIFGDYLVCCSITAEVRKHYLLSYLLKLLFDHDNEITGQKQ